MSKVRIAINGFGRIGRVLTRVLQNNPHVELIAINDLMDLNQQAILLKYDSIHGKLDGKVVAKDNCLEINDSIVYVYNCKDPEDLPWAELDIDVVVECTGVFKTKEKASKHINAGAKKVLISAPVSDNIPTIVMGINEHVLSLEEQIISNASCTTNCAAPMVKIIDEACGIKKGILTTVHAYTGDQSLHDSPHKDLRRARAGAENIVPTSTGATNVLAQLFPHLHGSLFGSAIRVPVPVGSITEMTFEIERKLTVGEVNNLFKQKAENDYMGILEYTDDPIVSSDVIGNTHSCIFDAGLTIVNGNLLKISGWYDNEVGYSNRLMELAIKMG